jgi:cell division protein FtsB
VAKLEEQAARIVELEAENEELSKHQDAIDYFAKKGYIAKRAAGRPVQKTKEKEAANA